MEKAYIIKLRRIYKVYKKRKKVYKIKPNINKVKSKFKEIKFGLFFISKRDLSLEIKKYDVILMRVERNAREQT